MINLRENYWAVEVPEGAATFELLPGGVLMSYDHKLRQMATALLSPSTWEIVCTSNNPTEEQISDLVGPKIKDGFAGQAEGYMDYYVTGCDLLPLPTKMKSFESLLKAKGCEVNNNWLIIKKG